MKRAPLYLCQIEKEKRVRIKITIEGTFANALVVTCHTPQLAGMPFAWQIQNQHWNLDAAKDRKDFEQLVSACQKETSRNFNVAMQEALQFNKRPTHAKQPPKKTKHPQLIEQAPFVSKEEILAKILQLHPNHSSYKIV